MNNSNFATNRFIANLSDMQPLMNETFQHGGTFRIISAGTSMLPFLRDKKDTVVLQAPNFPLNKYDIPLYIRSDGKYVLHRILKVKKMQSGENQYIMCGDNQLKKEYGITDKNIIASVAFIERNGKKVDFSSIKYNIYIFIWCRCFFIRFILLKLRSTLGRLLKMMRKKL